MKKLLIVAIVMALTVLGAWQILSSLQSSNETPSSEVVAPASATVNLSNTGLTKVGPEVYNKTDTVILNLSNNQIKTLPTEMGKMTKLQDLNLSQNLLDGSLIAEVRKMPLKKLDVSNNNMTGMPAEIGQLSKLETLNYSNNKITGLPNELKNLKNNLKEFNLTGNPLSAEAISKLKADLPNTTIIY